MNELLSAALETGKGGALAGFVVLLRIGAAMAILPGFGEHSVPVRVKLALALVFTAIVSPAVGTQVAPLTQGLGTLLACFATESVIGLALGLVLRLMTLALEMAGTIAAQSSSLSQLFGAGGEPMPTMSHLLVAGSLALAMMAGLHVRLAEALILSYDALPPGRFPDATLMRYWGVDHIGRAFALAFSLAAPFVIASFVYNLALGAINRAMPQLMVAFVGAPAVTAGALVLLAIAAPVGLSLWAGYFNALVADPFGAAR
ncbi:flagellar biosynthetic protein FliR [Defluviimonas salinarum]|uniref:Flagellar biosynthetic protein FliR n=1 Tax=Defluviimonas salinarum TaxID=2992147 RepID=A0ABT3J2Z6_9RHOB|nr:flagellar biosynthetic protein FliR [Defluviimonas salinarum]MCW3782036.1 flagellar biosynthetic protein FliR [Defluviimonas salinarum]